MQQLIGTSLMLLGAIAFIGHLTTGFDPRQWGGRGCLIDGSIALGLLALIACGLYIGGL